MARHNGRTYPARESWSVLLQFRMPTYRQLDETQITRTLEELRDRIGERFPQSNLRQLSEQLLIVAHEVSQCVTQLRRPNWVLRVAGGAAIACGTSHIDSTDCSAME